MFFIYNIFKEICDQFFFIEILKKKNFFPYFVHVFNLGVKPWSVP